MKKMLALALAFIWAENAYSQNKFIPNPASAYVNFMGYGSEIRQDSLGNQSKVCIFPDGSECDEWLFFRGICGKEFSYCALKGCETENYVDSLNLSSYAICLCIDSLGNQKKIPLLDFMEQNGDSLFAPAANSKKREVKK